jgi:hypothetical protein
MAVVNIVAEVAEFSREHGYIKAWETFTWNKNKTSHRLWTIWTKDIRVTEKDIIEVTGELSTKSATYVPKNAVDPKQIVEHSLNNVAYIVQQVPGTQVRNAADILTQKTEQEAIDLPF